MNVRGALLLAAIAVLFLVLFAVQRERSSFLQAETRAGEARAIAAELNLPPREVLALHEMLGGRLAVPELRQQAGAFARARDATGDPLLAILVVRGKPEVARQLRAAAGDDPAALHRMVHACREAVDVAVRFEAVAERFAARGY